MINGTKKNKKWLVLECFPSNYELIIFSPVNNRQHFVTEQSVYDVQDPHCHPLVWWLTPTNENCWTMITSVFGFYESVQPFQCDSLLWSSVWYLQYKKSFKHSFSGATFEIICYILVNSKLFQKLHFSFSTFLLWIREVNKWA